MNRTTGLAALICLPVLAAAASADGAGQRVEIDGRIFDAAEIAAGEAVFERRCSQCHGLDGRNYKGPFLNGILDRPAASVPDWDYSEALRGWGGVWTVGNLQSWLTRPEAFIPGIAMNFGGFRNRTEDRDRVIAYLISLGR
ncbi:MAG: c-type cytochrome [Gemmobacter sp.]